MKLLKPLCIISSLLLLPIFTNAAPVKTHTIKGEDQDRGFEFTFTCSSKTSRPIYRFKLPNGKVYIADYNKGYSQSIVYTGYRGVEHTLPKYSLPKDKTQWNDLKFNASGFVMTFQIGNNDYTAIGNIARVC